MPSSASISANTWGPLYRYLRQQVNRSWAKVYGELCAQLDRRSVVQAHLFQHIEDKVAIETSGTASTASGTR